MTIEETIDEALHTYRCDRTVDENGDGLGLADILAPPGENDVSGGLEEIEALADWIVGALMDEGFHG